MNRLLQSTALAAVLGFAAPALAQSLYGTMYKDPNCPCCEGHAAYLQEHGIELDVKPVENLEEISRKAGIPANYQGCHTILLNGYAFEGHIKIDLIQRLLDEHPDDVAGISLPGMPTAVPGMGGPYLGPYDVYAIHKDGTATVFGSQ
jgi:hypothetical protein